MTLRNGVGGCVTVTIVTLLLELLSMTSRTDSEVLGLVAFDHCTWEGSCGAYASSEEKLPEPWKEVEKECASPCWPSLVLLWFMNFVMLSLREWAFDYTSRLLKWAKFSPELMFSTLCSLLRFCNCSGALELSGIGGSLKSPNYWLMLETEGFGKSKSETGCFVDSFYDCELTMGLLPWTCAIG